LLRLQLERDSARESMRAQGTDGALMIFSYAARNE
jgi:hypothetical protein